ncbi:MAG: pilus assembly protein N-terminal domain-containing protein [Dehalococcoidales bacterium]|nr:pilus assembly protein N-terminal domain-containing protein [Dehalococcoidales bacterium]
MIRFLLCLVVTFMVFPAYAGNNGEGLYNPEKDGYYEQADSEGLSPIILNLAISLYKSERFEQAKRQFEIVLTLRPGDKTALKYLALIKKRLGETEEKVTEEETAEEETAEEETAKEELPLTSNEAGLKQEEFVGKQIDSMMQQYDEPAKPPVKTKEIPEPKEKSQTKETAKATPSTKIPKVLILNAKTKKPTFSLEIEQNEIITVKGNKLKRILLTQPDIVSIEKDTDVLYISGRNIGKTYLHIWDAQQRWTIEFKTIAKKQQGFGNEDIEKYAEERAKELKVRYTLVTNYSKTVNDSPAVPYFRYRSFQHILESATPLETPNGNYGFSASVNSLPEKTEMNYASVRWLNGQLGPLENINLQAIDFRPEMADLAFNKADLRGIQISNSLADNKLRSRFFWGEEQVLRFGGFVPAGLEYKKQQIFYGGVGMDYLAGEDQVYSLAAYQGGGKDRAADQHKNAYDLKALYKFDKLKLIPEIAFDTETYASNIRIDYDLPTLKMITELRNISKDFQAISGKDYRAGQKGVLVDVYYRPSEKILLTNKIDVFSDGLYPNPDLPGRWNKELSLGYTWAPVSLIEAQGDYNYRNYMGKNFPTITQSTGLGVRYKFPTERRINFYMYYNRNRNRYIKTPALDYLSNKITGGSLFYLLPSLYCFLEKEINHITLLSTSESALPKAVQTGIEWSSQVYNTAFYHSLRLTYRDEQNTNSPLSFLVGEDYIEGYGEISFAPTPYFNFGLNARVRDIRPEATPSEKRFETEILAGVNYLFNTHLRFDPVGTVEGYVFEDLNLDGIKQADEPAMPGIELRIVNKRIQSTGRTGAYKFMNVKAKKVYISVNTATIPEGFILTGPPIREAVIVNNNTTVLNFGVSSRTEIRGAVFEDTDGDYKFGLHDKGVPRVALILEDGSKIYTDAYGSFSIRLQPGKYRIKLDLLSIPEQYIPMVPVFSDFELSEGQSLNYAIPLLKFK